MRFSASEIEECAARWIVGAGSAEDAAGAQLEHWLEEDPRHRAAYLRLQVVWGKTARLKNLRGADKEIDEDLLRGEDSPAPALAPRGRVRRGGMLALAAVLVLAVIGTAVWMNVGSPRWQTHSTEAGGFARVTLRDGSTVDLNGNSEIRVRLSGERREVALVRGEGHFVVADDARRPFSVAAGGRVVRVLGTAFSVRLDARAQVDVLVTEGRVAVGAEGEQAGEATLLTAGEAANAGRDTLQVRSVQPEEVTRRLAWAAERLYFSGETLADAVAQFNRYTTRKLVIDDPTLGQLRIGGNFRATDADAFVQALADSFGIDAEVSAAGTVRLGKAPR